MLVLDTDVVSNLMRRRPSPNLKSQLAEAHAAGQTLHTTTITLGELCYGAYKANRIELFELAIQILSSVQILDFDQPSAQHYGRLRADFERQGIRLADPDLRIASTVLTHTATLVTGNIRHFERIPELSLSNWL
ncbi:MAG: PIN domain-containing protein [Candidatus Dormibacteraceae bacterium]